MHINHFFRYQGRNSKEFGLKIYNEMEFPVPERDVSFQTIPGRSGDVVFDNGRYKDITRTFSARILQQNDMTIDQQAKEITAWLRSNVKWSRFEFTGYSNYYYVALCYGTFSIMDFKRINAFRAETSVPFLFRPFKYRIDGESKRTLKKGDALVNFESVSANPLIIVTGVGRCELVFMHEKEKRILEIDGMSKAIYIDVETQKVYSDGMNMSHKVFSYPFPVLYSGTTTISWKSEHTVEIVPRWRALV